MRYTPSQVRQVVGISQETLRHWRSSLSSLSGIKGHAPVFRPGQLLGLAVIRTLVEGLGLGVGSLKAAESDIFEVCRNPQWIRLAQGYLLIRPADGTARFVERITDGNVNRTTIVLPMERIVTSLREALLEVAPEEVQQSIAFPPVGMATRRSVANRKRA
jgi:KaiC/GvpD/RAD55 family RecA-like ATPase